MDLSGTELNGHFRADILHFFIVTKVVRLQVQLYIANCSLCEILFAAVGNGDIGMSPTTQLPVNYQNRQPERNRLASWMVMMESQLFGAGCVIHALCLLRRNLHFLNQYIGPTIPWYPNTEVLRLALSCATLLLANRDNINQDVNSKSYGNQEMRLLQIIQFYFCSSSNWGFDNDSGGGGRIAL